MLSNHVKYFISPSNDSDMNNNPIIVHDSVISKKKNGEVQRCCGRYPTLLSFSTPKKKLNYHFIMITILMGE